jgi:hypothetical protein
MDKFGAFKQKEKFVEDMTILYPGIADPALRPILVERINLAADDFYEVSLRVNPGEMEYHEAVKLGLKGFEMWGYKAQAAC